MSAKAGRTTSRPIYISSISREKVTSGLHVGQVLRGMVLEQLADELYMINFRGFNLNSRSKSRLHRGKNIYVRITDIGEQIIMRLLPEEEYRQALIDANADEIDSCLEGIGVEADHQNRFIASEMLRFRCPLSWESFKKVLGAKSNLKLDNGADIQSLVYLVSKGYSMTPDHIGTAKYLGFPLNSKLLDELMNMRKRKPEKGDGVPVLVFDDDEKSGVCFRFVGDNLGAIKVIAIVNGIEVKTEMIMEDGESGPLLASNQDMLSEILGKDGLDLKELLSTIEGDTSGESDGGRPGIPIGIDFRI